MITYLPYASFSLSAEVLDTPRLMRQVGDSRKLVRTIVHGVGPLLTHRATHMWGRNVTALMAYHDTCLAELSRRVGSPRGPMFGVRAYTLPEWFGDLTFHASHKALLMAKDPDHYRKYDWLEKPQAVALWPTYH